MQKHKSIVNVFLAFLVMCPVCLWAGGFALRVEDVSGLDEPWPLAVGLPFPKGALKDAAAIRITSNGREVPAQVDVTAIWPDGSVRWALAGFTDSPQSGYRVEFGPGVTRSAPAIPLSVQRQSDGKLTVNTGAAVYEFLPDALMPESVKVDNHTVVARSGDGAYLVDNLGRTSRVIGSQAGVTNEVLKEGPGRVVLRRTGWYVTTTGERVARARACFYFSAGSLFLRVTHSLTLTEDTNKLWVRDYGLEFRTPAAPEKAIFALGEPGKEKLFSTMPAGNEVNMRQDTYPHFLERDSRAAVERIVQGRAETLEKGPVAGDWADASFGSYGLTVVMPWMAQQFPKEIAFWPGGARAVFWSGRSGRELDFRSQTLVNEYWQGWAKNAPGGASALAKVPSNAQCASRTHDVWLLPHPAKMTDQALKARAIAAARPPLILAEPEWLCATEAIGWPMHQKDEGRFPREEKMISGFWDRLMSGYEGLPMTGFIAWGCQPYIQGANFFRLSRLVDYGMRRHVWGLYARSGERKYYEYGSRFNRFAGDWEMAHWTAGDKYIGGFAGPYGMLHLPFYWGSISESLVNDISGHDIQNWLMEYYMTGDEYALELTRLFGEAIRERWDAKTVFDGPAPFMILRAVTSLYTREWDDAFARMARELAGMLIDLNNPNGLTNKMRLGALYKVDRNASALYDYYMATGDESARKAILKALDYQYRFNRVPPPISYQNAAAFLFTIGYRWTGNPGYIRLVNQLVQSGLDETGTYGGPQLNMHPTLGMPAALGLLAEVKKPIDPFPVLDSSETPGPSAIIFRKGNAERPLEMSIFVSMPTNAEMATVVSSYDPVHPGKRLSGIQLQVEPAFHASYAWDAGAQHVRLTIPAGVPAGLYTLRFPDAESIVVLDTEAVETGLYAPEGFRLKGEGVPYYFRVREGTEELRIIMGRPMKLRRPDDSAAIQASNKAIGEMHVPVQGKAGIWSVRATHPGYVRLLNAEPVFAQGLAQWLPTGTDARPAERFQPQTNEAFVPSPSGRAAHLAGNRTLRFPRGTKQEDGYQNFPGKQGTVEFWFRPNWSSTDLAVRAGDFRDFHFVRSGSHDLQYRYGERGWSQAIFAVMNLWIRGQTGNEQGKGQDANVGFMGRRLFAAGEWHHVAATWRIYQGKRGTEGSWDVFIDGVKIRTDSNSSPSFPVSLPGTERFNLKESNEWITIGPLDGAIAQLRISDIVRYDGVFTPPKTSLGVDGNTRAIFHLDGDFAGFNGAGEKIMLTE